MNEGRSGSSSRFVAASRRTAHTDLPRDSWRALTERYEQVKWRGVHLDKSPLELGLYPMLMFEEGIASVIELGAGTGGSAMWLADHLRMSGGPGRVLSVDRDLEQLHSAARAHPGVSFIRGDCARLEEVLVPELLAECPHPWLVIEDAHEGVLEALAFLHEGGLQAGDYVIVEDTNVALWEAWRDWPDAAFIERMLGKGRELAAWLKTTEDSYRVDTHYQDMFGYNAAKAANAILRRM